MNSCLKIDHKLLVNKELLDLDKPTVTEDDYLEAYFVYLHMLTDTFGVFAEKISDDFFE